MPRDDITAALGALDDITRRLRIECPWDREQDERTIVPHTLEEAYELADAANSGDDAKLRDELGDVLFQVHFLSLLLEERGAGDLAAVAAHCRRKLIRRHPHVFAADSTEMAEVLAADAAERDAEGDRAGAQLRDVTGADDVLANWDAIKKTEAGREGGIFGEVPDNLPSLLFARKVQRRAASSGFDPIDVDAALEAAHAELDRLAETIRAGARAATFQALGDALFAVTNVARKAKADPEIALRSASIRFRDRVLRAEVLAEAEGRTWADLGDDDRLGYYAQVLFAEGGPGPEVTPEDPDEG
ncbi:MazG nucleotide pyrophosphohydrolase domain-containing protein [Patulibacter sp. NPDC049589]|uniref:MazG nucleotide pyrophosphohydrolase domain-containing protein n=1 Tax=Patulibacter sp. NPDC049589 TaxID=3154731 RepID=UPI0034403456